MSAFEEVMDAAAWKSMPSWYPVGQNDEAAITADVERQLAHWLDRMMIEIPLSHVPDGLRSGRGRRPGR
jgi:hypothetical protein